MALGIYIYIYVCVAVVSWLLVLDSWPLALGFLVFGRCYIYICIFPHCPKSDIWNVYICICIATDLEASLPRSSRIN